MAPTPLNIRLGRAIARLREAQGYSQEKFADKCKMHRNYVSLLERGKINPSILFTEKMAKALKVKASELLAEAEKERGG